MTWSAVVAGPPRAPVTLVGSAGAEGAGATRPVTVTYDVQGAGNVSDLEALAAEAAAVYADPRGWSLGGGLRFVRVPAGGNFTLWLAAADRVAAFGGFCERRWSCRTGRNVVINEDRWLGASRSWTAAGAPLSAYRQMVLNHETGHWLGFGHAVCPGAGASAPVMQQQSISLRGCDPNPWPLPGERAALAARRGVLPRPMGASAEPTPAARSQAPAARPKIPTARPKAPAARPPVRAARVRVPAARPPAPAVVPGREAACLRLPRVPLRPWIRCL